jgi:hypothetical protein
MAIICLRGKVEMYLMFRVRGKSRERVGGTKSNGMFR